VPTIERSGPRPHRRPLTLVLALGLGGALLAPVTAAAQTAPTTTTEPPTTATPTTAPEPTTPPTTVTETTAAPTTVPPTTAAPTTTAPPAAAPRTLRIGMAGADVKALQNRLIALRYIDIRSASGVFDTPTSHAVVALQKHHGLTRDGIVGPLTRARLAAPSTPRPRVRRSGGYYEVNLTKQVMYGFSGSTVVRIINISSGSGRLYTVDGVTYRATTPTGTFRIQRKIDGWRQSDLGLLYRPAYFTGGFAVHGSSSVPSTPASHGCIRVNLWTQDRIWDYLPVGRIIAIYK
jgi:peptidoglycan hydrolase-like protein with peptidoglycan-binding domain